MLINSCINKQSQKSTWFGKIFKIGTVPLKASIFKKINLSW